MFSESPEVSNRVYWGVGALPSVHVAARWVCGREESQWWDGNLFPMSLQAVYNVSAFIAEYEAGEGLPFLCLIGMLSLYQPAKAELLTL